MGREVGRGTGGLSICLRGGSLIDWSCTLDQWPFNEQDTQAFAQSAYAQDSNELGPGGDSVVRVECVRG